MHRFLLPVARSLGGAALAVTLAAPNPGRADTTVLPGWDLFETVPSATVFNGMNWHGVPLGTYDFGGTIGTQPVGGTDTIVERLAAADAPSETIPIELVALQLQSVQDPTLFITLQSLRGGPASAGTMTIEFGPEGNPHGTFDSFFDVFFDVRLGALNGPIVASDVLSLTSLDNPWAHEVPPGVDPAAVINGVNRLLNGQNILNDFWPASPAGAGGIPALLHSAAGGQHHGVRPPVPDGGHSLALLGLPVAAFALCRRRRPSR